MFGFMAKYQVRWDFSQSGRFPTSIGARNYPHAIIGHRNPCNFVFEDLESNTPPAPNLKALTSNSYSAYTPSDMRAQTTTAQSQRGFRYDPAGGLTRNFRALIAFPHLVKALDYQTATGGSGAGTGSIHQANLQIPYFVNLESININGGNGANTIAAITSITGQWPQNRFTLFQFLKNWTPDLNSIQHPFPVSILTVRMWTSSASIGSDLNRLVSEAVNLVTLSCTDELLVAQAAGDPNSICPIAGALNLSHCFKLAHLFIEQCPLLTDITFDPANTTWNRIKITNCFNINSTSYGNLMHTFMQGVAHTYLMMANCNRVFSKTFTDSEFKSTLIRFEIYSNVITGTITLTTAKPAIVVFSTGNSALKTIALKNSFSVVNVTGVTNAATIDLSNSQIADLQLPVNTVIATLRLGGNQLDIVTNPNLINQVVAMTSLTLLAFNIVVDTADIESNFDGQVSTNGLGADVNLSPLVNVTTLYIASCKLTGTLTLPNVNKLTTLIAGYNVGLTSIVNFATHTSMSYVNLYGCTNLVIAIPNTFTALHTVLISRTKVTAIDMSGKSTTTIVSVQVSSNPDLTVFTLPAVVGRCVVSNATQQMHINANVTLTAINNLDKISYEDTSGNELNYGNFQGNSILNIMFPFGVNSFIPRQMLLLNNAMDTANLDATVDSAYANIRKWDNYTNTVVTFNIGGTNGICSGTYAAPVGYKNAAITNITRANPAVVTVSAIGSLANDDVIRIRNVNGMTQINNKYYMIKNISGNTFQLYNEAGTVPINSGGHSNYTTNGLVAVQGTPANVKEKLHSLVNTYGWTITIN